MVYALRYITLARTVLGKIDFDPFSSPAANRVIRAKEFFTVEDDAFTKTWPIVDTVWMNPPYGRGEIANAVKTFVRNTHKFKEAIVLVNAATDTEWFHELISHGSAVCCTDHRISFWNTDGKRSSGNTRGQAFLYFGSRKHAAILNVGQCLIFRIPKSSAK